MNPPSGGLVTMVISLLYLPILTTPNEGFNEADFYQTMTPSRYAAIEWIHENTPENSVLVADAEYGWWISGFSERPTLSAANPQFLILAHEIEPAQTAKNILHSDYFIDNGFLRIEYYKSQQTSSFFDLKANFDELLTPYLFFSVIDKQINLIYRKNNSIDHIHLDEIPITHLDIENGSNWAEFKVTTENEQMLISESVTVYEGTRFAKIKMCLEAKIGDLSFNWLHVPFTSQGKPMQLDNSIGFVDSSIRVVNQIIFPDNGEQNTPTLLKNQNNFELVQNLEGKRCVNFEFYVGCYHYSPSDESNYDLNQVLENKTNNYLDVIATIPLSFFDYKKAISSWNISYIVTTKTEMMEKIWFDPLFEVVYQNGQVTIFRVVK